MVGAVQYRPLDAMVRDLFAPLIEGASLADGWRLASWDAEQGLSVLLERQESLLLVEVDRLDLNRQPFVRTARFDLSGRPQFEEPRSLTDSEQAAMLALAEVIREREGRLPVFERPPPSRRVQIREVLVDRMLVPEGRGHYYLNPYAGCMIGCPWCYVAEKSDAARELEGLPALPWGQHVDVKVNAAEVLRAEVARLPPGIVRISAVLTDAYQPLEARHRITRACLEVLAEAGFEVMLLTRAARVVEDIELLLRFKRAVVAMSVPTDDDHVRRYFEPGADPIPKRLETLAACHEAGLPTVAFVQPALPQNPERLASLLAPHVLAVRIERMHADQELQTRWKAQEKDAFLRPGWFEQTRDVLLRSLEERGVMVDEIEDLGQFFDRLDLHRRSSARRAR